MGGNSLLRRLVSVFGLTLLCQGRYNGSRTEIVQTCILKKKIQANVRVHSVYFSGRCGGFFLLLLFWVGVGGVAFG